MPRRQAEAGAGDDLPPFKPKIKRRAASSREGKQVQAFLSPEEDERLEALVEASQMSKKDYLRCLIRYAIQQGLALDENSQPAAARAAAKARKEG